MISTGSAFCVHAAGTLWGSYAKIITRLSLKKWRISFKSIQMDVKQNQVDQDGLVMSALCEVIFLSIIWAKNKVTGVSKDVWLLIPGAHSE
jgi:hypothetical protein